MRRRAYWCTMQRVSRRLPTHAFWLHAKPTNRRKRRTFLGHVGTRRSWIDGVFSMGWPHACKASATFLHASRATADGSREVESRDCCGDWGCNLCAPSHEQGGIANTLLRSRLPSPPPLLGLCPGTSQAACATLQESDCLRAEPWRFTNASDVAHLVLRGSGTDRHMGEPRGHGNYPPSTQQQR